MKALLFAAAAVSAAKATAPPVDLLICTESLCSGCQDFVTTDLAEAINQTEIAAITNLTAVPFGNAHYHPLTHTATCQHGELECEGNSWEQCAIAHYPDTKDWFPFYYCMEKLCSEGTEKLPTEKCAEAAGLDYSTLQSCVNGPEARDLLKKAYEDTPADHEYVPWVVINGKLWKQEGSLTHAICKAYKEGGGEEPAACTKASGKARFEPKFHLDFMPALRQAK